MSETVTINGGQTLSEIVQNKYHLKGWSNIQAKCEEIKLFNNQNNSKYQVNDIGNILAGKTLVLPDDTDTVTSTISAASAPKSETPAPAAETPAATEKPAEPNLGKKFDDWSIDTAVNIKLAHQDSRLRVRDFVKEHSKPEDEPLRYLKGEEEKLAVKDEISKMESFCFSGDGVKVLKKDQYINGTTSDNGLLRLSKDSMANVKDLDGDPNTMNLDEFLAKEKEDQTTVAFKVLDRSNEGHKSDGIVKWSEYERAYFAANPEQTEVPAELKTKFEALAKDKEGISLDDMKSNLDMFKTDYDEETAKRVFATTDTNNDTKLDIYETAIPIAVKDDKDDKLNGLLKAKDIIGCAAGNPELSETMKNKYTQWKTGIFGEIK